MAKISVRGVDMTVAATITYLGLTFYLSRPVDPKGVKRRDGWVLSYESHVMAVLADCDQKLAESFCKHQLSKCTSKSRLQSAITQTIADQAATTFTEFSERKASKIY